MGTWFASVLRLNEAEVKGETDENKDKVGRKERGNGKGRSCKNMCIRRRGNKPSCQLCSLEAMAEHGKDNMAGKMTTASDLCQGCPGVPRAGTSLPLSNGGNIPALPCGWDTRTEYAGDDEARGHQLERVWGAGWKGEVCVHRNDD